MNVSRHINISAINRSVLPREMMFNDDSLVSVITYVILFIISAIGNLTVFITLCRNRRRQSRVNMFILHLCIADLIVTFMMIPMEVGWHATVSWKAGDIACRVFMFFRTFGFYLSSFVLIAISLDRYLAITYPLSLNDVGKRGKLMLIFAWLFSMIASTPQSVIFHIESHPAYPWFTQCVTFNFFPSSSHELAYNLFNLITLYVLPLIVVTVSYSLILMKISKRTNKNIPLSAGRHYSRVERVRHSGNNQIEKAKRRTLKMTIVIVAVFVMCWTPYFVISVWWWIDKDSAQRINHKIQRGLFIFAVSNSCMNPFVYGAFAIKIMNELRRCCCCLPKPQPKCYNQQKNAHIRCYYHKQHAHILSNCRHKNITCYHKPLPAPTNPTQRHLQIETWNPNKQKTTLREGIAKIRLDTLYEVSSKSTSKRDSTPPTPPHISQGKGIDFEEESIVVITR